MKIKTSILFFLFFSTFSFAQDIKVQLEDNRKGDLYFYWGWNESWYTNSDIHFKGDNFDFTLSDVIAYDRPTKFTFAKYFNPLTATIPQYNFRIGYFIRHNYDFSFAIDHMKYVVQNGQTVKINGKIENTGTEYDRAYEDEDLFLKSKFLRYEHTDGLNYISFSLRRFDKILRFKNFQVNLTEGVGLGALIPRTDALLFEQDRHDKVHLSGYGLNGCVGINMSFFNAFFIQTELKGGFIHMPDVKITPNPADQASQHFFFLQSNLLFGGIFHLNKKKRLKEPESIY